MVIYYTFCSIFVAFLVLAYIKPVWSMDLSKDKNLDLWDYDDKYSSRNRCLPDDDSCQNEINFLDRILKRKNKNYGGMERVQEYYHSSRPMPCACDMEFRLKDLGHAYFPRYIHIGECRSKGCNGLYKCQEKKYQMHVLRKRGMSNLETCDNSLLPENLREFWQCDTINVTVACVCSLKELQQK